MTELELRSWLEMNVAHVFERFLSVAGEGSLTRGEGDTRFLYIPGNRPDRVLLLAHADTKWDAVPAYPAPVRTEQGIYSSCTADLGIGADDRAGCAMLWELRALGHSLLVTRGEEKGCLASHWIADENPDVLAELNSHQFMVQFDRQNATDFKCYDVGTDEFRAYVQAQTGFREPDRERGTDIKVLAKQICGVNLSVGFYAEHTPAERLVFAEWEHSLRVARAWLAQPGLPKFTRPVQSQT
ncbi:MAG: hypothetical protein HY238_13870 [Acidobacteria bacterium]|nr:hypothetical protein [Acidobacteriota bacterium]